MIYQPAARVLSIDIPIELTNDNDGRKRHYFKSASNREKYEKLLRSRNLVCRPLGFPVIVHVTRVLGPGQKFWDSSSCGRGNWKEIEDSMVACGWFRNDNMNWIKETRFFQDDTRRYAGPFTQVELFRVANIEVQQALTFAAPARGKINEPQRSTTSEAALTKTDLLAKGTRHG